MTALVMTSEVDLAIERILSDRNATAATSVADADSDITSASEEAASGTGQDLATVFGSAGSASPPAKKDKESGVDFGGGQSVGCEENEEAGKSPSGGNGQEAWKKKAEEFLNSAYEYLIDDALLGLVFEAHRAAKTGLFFLYDSTEANDDDDFRMIVDEHGYADIFGQALVPSSKSSKALSQLECVCPQCHQSRLACRFAPHLEKCMGMGRNSSRIASRRLAASAAAAANTANSASWCADDPTPTLNGRESSDDAESDDDQFVTDDDDDDWTMGGGGSGTGASAFARKKSQRKRGQGAGSSARTPRKRGGGSKITPKKNAASGVAVRSAGSNASFVGDMLLNENPGKIEGMKRLRKTSSYSKFPATTSSGSSYNIEMDAGSGVHDFLSMADSYDPPSPSF